MKTAAALTCAILAAAAVATPHHNAHKRRHVHHQHEKRDAVTTWVTETEYVTEYIDASTTQLLFPAASSSDPGQFFEGASSDAPTASAEQYSPAAAAPTSAAAAPPPAPPAANTPAPPPANVPAPAPAAPPPPPPAAAPPNVASPGTVAPANAYNGDLTWYTIGLGACGEDDSGRDNSVQIVALSYLLMGSQSTDNPFCNRTITISANGKTTQAIVKDKCMGCAQTAIDVSQLTFQNIWGDLGIGRKSVTWWFN